MYKDLLVAIDASETNGKRVDYAIRLAKRFDAHLTALYLIPRYAPPASTGIGVHLTADIQGKMDRLEQEQADKAIARFKEAADREGVAHDTRQDRGFQVDFGKMLSVHGRYTDAVIAGQPAEDQTGAILDTGDVVLSSGAPVIIVPYVGSPDTTAERVMIAWNASRESARAVRDAMPLLEKAKRVDIVCFRPRQGGDGHGDMPGADIALHLARHDIQVDVEVIEAKDIDVGNALLSHLADRGSDMLVMGGYGHSRLREFILGGATRTILQSMTVPVLMTH